jgi:hypothetical protein
LHFEVFLLFFIYLGFPSTTYLVDLKQPFQEEGNPGMTYRVQEITGEFATDSESGQQVYDLVHPALLAGHSVELDFGGATVFASAFFNFAIGQLLKDLSPDRLNELLKITNLSPNGHSILKRVIENAKHYYSDAEYQNAVDTVLEQYAASF